MESMTDEAIMGRTVADGSGHTDAADLSIEECLQRFFAKRQADSTDRTLRSYRSRLTRFEDWTAEQDIQRMGDLDPWHIDQYDLSRREDDLAPTTIKGNLTTLRVFLKYARDIGAVDDAVVEAVSVPSLDPHQEKSSKRLNADDARDALSFFRGSQAYFGVPMHASLEVTWHTGARMSGLRALDLGDYDSEDRSLSFKHRPQTGTGLKNKLEGERLVGLSADVCSALDAYIARERSDKRDDNGREPLFAGRQGRASFSTLRAWSYQASQPCLWTECPHGKRRPTCEWTERTHASKCPSSRSPHAVRTGSITWQLNQGMDIERVAVRVNAAPSTIRRYYDAATDREEFEERRRETESKLDISQEDDTE